MKILYVSQYFPPETCAPAARVSELSRAWAEQGHEVTVLTGFPNHPGGRVHPEYRRKLWRFTMTERAEGARVLRTWLAPLPNRKSWERALNYGSFCVSAMLRGVWTRRPDVLIATSPQLLVGVAGLALAKLKHVPFVFEVRDLWPESLVAVGVSGNESRLVRALGWVAKTLYRCADHIVVVSPAFRENLERDWQVPPERISVVVNGVRTDLFHPAVDGGPVRRELGLDDRFVVSFMGTIGNAHGLEVLVEAARRLQESHPRIALLVVGEGAEKDKLRAQAAAAALPNLMILERQPRERMPAFIRAADVCLVLLRKGDVFKTVIPTKMLEFMACGRAVIVSVEGTAADIVQNAGAGLCVPPEDAGALAAAIVRLYEDAALRRDAGENGARYIRAHMAREKTAADYLGVLAQITAGGRANLSGVVATEPAAQKEN